MIFSHEIIVNIIIFFFSLFGFFVARYIYNHKTKNTPLVCMVGFDCHGVVHSDYSRFLGIRVEILGMFYYAFTAVFYLLLVITNSLVSELPEPLVFLLLPIGTLFIYLSLVAFLFSVYLIAVQTFIIKKACSWCIVSAFISALIFILVFFT